MTGDQEGPCCFQHLLLWKELAGQLIAVEEEDREQIFLARPLPPAFLNQIGNELIQDFHCLEPGPVGFRLCLLQLLEHGYAGLWWATRHDTGDSRANSAQVCVKKSVTKNRLRKGQQVPLSVKRLAGFRVFLPAPKHRGGISNHDRCEGFDLLLVEYLTAELLHAAGQLKLIAQTLRAAAQEALSIS